MLIPFRFVFDGGSEPPQSTQGAAVLPRHVILEKLEEEAMIAELLSEDY